jgi:hypothetical protein
MFVAPKSEKKALPCNEFSLRTTRSRVYVATYTKTAYMTVLSYISGHDIHHFTCYLNSAYEEIYPNYSS